MRRVGRWRSEKTMSRAPELSSKQHTCGYFRDGSYALAKRCCGWATRRSSDAGPANRIGAKKTSSEPRQPPRRAIPGAVPNPVVATYREGVTRALRLSPWLKLERHAAPALRPRPLPPALGTRGVGNGKAHGGAATGGKKRR